MQRMCRRRGERTRARARVRELQRPYAMQCETCGNTYDKPIQIVKDGERHVYDCFACAIHALAPACACCHVKIIGHGLESEGAFYCCANCARQMGVPALRDRVEPSAA
jgi:hypothetical protein